MIISPYSTRTLGILGTTPSMYHPQSIIGITPITLQGSLNPTVFYGGIDEYRSGMIELSGDQNQIIVNSQLFYDRITLSRGMYLHENLINTMRDNELSISASKDIWFIPFDPNDEPQPVSIGGLKASLVCSCGNSGLARCVVSIIKIPTSFGNVYWVTCSGSCTREDDACGWSTRTRAGVKEQGGDIDIINNSGILLPAKTISYNNKMYYLRNE